ncbi:MAG: hypothetical protein NHB15_09770 [Methanosarcina barkeri]|nr:hypothetical protein [Methanosarcina sp. ERenArc_MAG2]
MSGTELTENELIEERIDLSRATCPNREQRANGINVWYGKASDLAKEARSGCLRQRERNFQQSSGCVLNFYLSKDWNNTRCCSYISCTCRLLVCSTRLP